MPIPLSNCNDPRMLGRASKAHSSPGISTLKPKQAISILFECLCTSIMPKFFRRGAYRMLRRSVQEFWLRNERNSSVIQGWSGSYSCACSNGHIRLKDQGQVEGVRGTRHSTDWVQDGRPSWRWHLRITSCYNIPSDMFAH